MWILKHELTLNFLITVYALNNHSNFISYSFIITLILANIYTLKYLTSAVLVHLRSVAQPGSASGLGPEGRRFKSCHSDHFMKKAKIYIPNKNPMQSGIGKTDKWILEFETKDPTNNPLMGWESSSDTVYRVKIRIFFKGTSS